MKYQTLRDKEIRGRRGMNKHRTHCLMWKHTICSIRFFISIFFYGISSREAPHKFWLRFSFDVRVVDAHHRFMANNFRSLSRSTARDWGRSPGWRALAAHKIAPFITVVRSGGLFEERPAFSHRYPLEVAVVVVAIERGFVQLDFD